MTCAFLKTSFSNFSHFESINPKHFFMFRHDGQQPFLKLPICIILSNALHYPAGLQFAQLRFIPPNQQVKFRGQYSEISLPIRGRSTDMFVQHGQDEAGPGV